MINRVRALRKFYGMSLQDLADKCGAGKTTLFEIEIGRHDPSAPLAIKIAKALHTTVEKLYYVDGEEEK